MPAGENLNPVTALAQTHSYFLAPLLVAAYLVGRI
jgi:hypothetical protein